ncbi:MAG: ATP-binding cassette domain-containing protein [Leptospiraceae bacterium]|nr:ATP-binding cassette domain-containing protein [Leptospiraceae bacterium]
MLEFSKLSFVRDGKFILKDISLSISEKQNWVVLGKNGSGKTTLINIIFGYLWPTTGTVKVLGKVYGEYPVREVQKKIGILQSGYQEERLQRNLSVTDVIASGLLNSIGIYSELNEEENQKVKNIIQNNSWIKNPNQNYGLLSSGEKKKILLLRALISEPSILILDEPCSSLDIASREDFFSLLDRYKTSSLCIILITHRTDEIPDYFDHVCLIKDGEIIASGKKGDVFNSENLSKTYDVNINLIEKNGQYFSNVIK